LLGPIPHAIPCLPARARSRWAQKGLGPGSEFRAEQGLLPAGPSKAFRAQQGGGAARSFWLHVAVLCSCGRFADLRLRHGLMCYVLREKRQSC
jgi:hypothetical protein